jgi:hypothetical protein
MAVGTIERGITVQELLEVILQPQEVTDIIATLHCSPQFARTSVYICIELANMSYTAMNRAPSLRSVTIYY